MNPSLDAPLPFARLGRYRVVRRLGKGGMGEVFLGHDPELDRPVALKVLRPDLAQSPQARERFQREARSIAHIQSEHVVGIYDVGQEGEVLYLALEFLEGRPLDAWIRERKRCSLGDAIRLVAETARGLSAAHALGWIHRDIKPSNLWVRAGTERVKILDFGLARLACESAGLTQEGRIVGTPAFLSPEQARGEPLDHRSDLFSLGVLLYWLTTGRMPFRGEPAVVIHQIIHQEPVAPQRHNPSIPDELAALALQLLAKIPGERPAGAEEVAERLEAFLRVGQLPTGEHRQALTGSVALEGSVATPAEDAGQRETKPVAAPISRRGLLLGAGLAVLGVGGAGVTWTLLSRGTTSSPGDGTVVPPMNGQRPAPSLSDREAAIRVIELGGQVILEDNGRWLSRPAEIPPGPVWLSSINLLARQLKAEQMAVFGELRNLKYLNLEATGLGLQGLRPFARNDGLVYLNLRYLGVTREGLELFRPCTRMKYLHLGPARLEDDAVPQIAGYEELVWLNLSHCPVTGKGLLPLRECQSLEHIELQHSKVTDIGLEAFARCEHLSHLNLMHTPIQGGGFAHLAACKRLTLVDLTKCLVDDEGIKALAGCTSVEDLRLTGNRLTDRGIEHLAGCTQLSELGLSHMPLTDISLQILAKLPRLKSLHVSFTRVTKEGVEAFKRQRPECGIVWIR